MSYSSGALQAKFASEAMAARLDPLVRIKSSVNDSVGLRAKAEFVVAYAKERIPGVEANIHTLDDPDTGIARSSVELRVRSKSGQTSGPVLLIAHLDTVTEPDDEPVPVGVSGDYFGGRGSLDDGAGVVAAIECVGVLADDGETGDIVVMISGEEEEGSPAFRNNIAATAAQASIVIGLEPGLGGHARIGRMGSHPGRIRFHGDDGHVNDPGPNAANAAGTFIHLFNTWAREAGASADSDNFRVQVGGIKSSTSETNSRPAWVEVPFTARAHSPALLTDVRAAMERIAALAAEGEACSDMAISFDVEYPFGFPAWPADADSHAWRLTQKVNDALGLPTLDGRVVAGGSDTSAAAQVNRNAVDGLAPWGRGFHKSDEAVYLPSFQPQCSRLVTLIAAAQGRDVIDGVPVAVSADFWNKK